jgi:Fe2+ transport system protein FeoA
MKRTNLQPAPLSTFSARHGALEIVEVDDSATEHKRMCELGLCPGRSVRVVRKGNPSIVSVGESRFALSLELLSRVYVRPLK